MAASGRVIGQGARFLLIGLFNTGFTVLVYQGLLFFMGPELSYTIAYAMGLVIVSILHPKVAFQVAQPSATTVGGILLYYIAIYFIGVSLLHLLEPIVGNPRLTIVLVLAILIPVNFLATRFLSLNERFSGTSTSE